jgi:hypothetical protein
MTNDVFDLLGTPEAMHLMKVAIEKATERRLSLGLPKSVQIRGEWLAQYPDGRLETIVRPGTTPEQRGTVNHTMPAKNNLPEKKGD